MVVVGDHHLEDLEVVLDSEDLGADCLEAGGAVDPGRDVAMQRLYLVKFQDEAMQRLYLVKF